MARLANIAMLVDPEFYQHGRFVPGSWRPYRHVHKGLLELGHKVTVVPYKYPFSDDILFEADLVFNLTEGVDGDRLKDYVVCDRLDEHQIRYTGSSGASLMMCRDKVWAKRAVADFGITVPATNPVFGSNELIVKPRFLDGSDEIHLKSVCSTALQLRRAEARLRDLGISSFREKFIEGNDVLVPILNGQVCNPIILRTSAAARGIATYSAKWDTKYSRRHRVQWKVNEALWDKVAEPAARAYKVLEMEGYGRIDFRLSVGGELYFIEANPNPNLHPHAFGNGICFPGFKYLEVLQTIINEGLGRPI